MALIALKDVCWGFGDPPLLDHVTLQIEKGERVGLLGRNGVGKSTLIRLLCGDIQPDRGEIWRQQGIRVAALEQEVPREFDGSVFDVVAGGLEDTAGDGADDEGWTRAPRIEKVLSKTHIDPNLPFADLSAGLKRRTMLARALVGEPDVLLLDEPTNHLDIDTIVWMEDVVRRQVKTLVFVTHDRAFLDAVANRIVELDRGRLYSYACDHASYQIRRQATLDAEEKQNDALDKKRAAEEAWIRQGIKARRTRNEGRVRALQDLREACRNRRSRIGNVRMQVQEAERTGKLVIDAEGIDFSHGGTPIVNDFSTAILRGDKVGIVGPNGIGKTTLLRILLKDLAPDQGRVRHGTHLAVAYFDQLRAGLDEEKTVQENVGEGNDMILFNGRRRHIIGYLQDFLFSPERCRTPVHILSGGEKNRLLLAKLFTRPANVLVLDEPTNDLDTETLELLEELLFEFTGTLLLVSHDRAFLNNVVTSIIAFEPGGRLIEYAGGYDDWRIQRAQSETAPPPEKKPRKNPARAVAENRPRRLGYMEKRELENLPMTIETLEGEQKSLYEAMSDPLFYKGEKDAIAQTKARLEAVEQQIETAYRRWEDLEQRSGEQ